MQPDYYTILGVSADADADAIRAAYRRLVRQHHPDLHPRRADAEARMRELNEAYAVLGDPEQRARYRATRGARIPVRTAADAPRSRPAAPPRPAPVRPTMRSHVDLSGAAPRASYAASPETLDEWEALMLLRTLRLLRALLDW